MAENSVDDIFLPEKVVDSGFGQQDGKRYYKVKWVRYTWEAEDSLSHLKELLDLFWTEHGGIPNSKEKSVETSNVLEKSIPKDDQQVDMPVEDIPQDNDDEQHEVISVLLKSQTEEANDSVVISTMQAVSTLQNIVTTTAAATYSDDKVKYITLEKHSCDICLRAYTSAQSLRAHKRSAHKNEKNFQCETCLKLFSEKSTLRRHMYIHLEEKPFKCDHCDKGFSDKSTLRRHLITHTGLKRFQCTSCGKRFTRNEHLRQHMFIHTEEKIYKCDVCLKDFRQRSTLKNHMLLHRAENAIKCELCGVLFGKQQQLDKHLLWCNGVTSTFKCEECDKCFQDRSGLKRHLLLHSGERPYKCDYCDQTFNDRSILRRHTFKHTEKKPFQCAVCSKEFLRKATLQSHVSREHGDEVNRSVFGLVQAVGYDINEGISLGDTTLEQQVRFVIQPEVAQIQNAIEVPSNESQQTSDGVSMLAHAVCNIPQSTIMTNIENKPLTVGQDRQLTDNQSMKLHMSQDLQPGENQLLQVQIIQMEDGNQFVQSIQAIGPDEERNYDTPNLVVDENAAIGIEEAARPVLNASGIDKDADEILTAETNVNDDSSTEHVSADEED